MITKSCLINIDNTLQEFYIMSGVDTSAISVLNDSSLTIELIQAD